jgi:hypothetical protein
MLLPTLAKNRVRQNSPRPRCRATGDACTVELRLSHTGSTTTTAVSPTVTAPESSIRVDATLAGYRQQLRWGNVRTTFDHGYVRSPTAAATRTSVPEASASASVAAAQGDACWSLPGTRPSCSPCSRAEAHSPPSSNESLRVREARRSPAWLPHGRPGVVCYSQPAGTGPGDRRVHYDREVRTRDSAATRGHGEVGGVLRTEPGIGAGCLWLLPNAEVSLFDLVDMADELSSIVGRRVDLVPKHGLKPQIRQPVLESARILYAAA